MHACVSFFSFTQGLLSVQSMAKCYDHRRVASDVSENECEAFDAYSRKTLNAQALCDVFAENAERTQGSSRAYDADDILINSTQLHARQEQFGVVVWKLVRTGSSSPSYFGRLKDSIPFDR